MYWPPKRKKADALATLWKKVELSSSGAVVSALVVLVAEGLPVLLVDPARDPLVIAGGDGLAVDLRSPGALAPGRVDQPPGGSKEEDEGDCHDP